MTDTPKPLSNEQLVDVFDMGPAWCTEETFARIQATIEARDQEIAKLRKKGIALAVEAAKFGREYGRKKAEVVVGPNGTQSMADYIKERATEALAATAPQPADTTAERKGGE